MMRVSSLLLLASLCLACDPEDTRHPDGRLDHDGGPPVDTGLIEGPDAGTTCDCCGTRLTTSGGGESCGGGICDPWCGLADPCGGTCDTTTSLCVYTFGGADAGVPPVDGGTGSVGRGTCVPRPAECEDLANCGGPTPDPSCDLDDPCFEALDCAPYRVVRSGDLVQCRGA